LGVQLSGAPRQHQSARGKPQNVGRQQPGMRRVRPDVVVIEPPALEQMAGVGSTAYEDHNSEPGPFAGTADPGTILDKINRPGQNQPRANSCVKQ
jgi:hypothetical protein